MMTRINPRVFCHNARLFIDEGCQVNEVPCNEPLRSSFEKLSRGIYSINSGSITFVNVNHTDFFDNVKGLYISASGGASHSTVTNSNFRVFRPGEDLVDAYGMYLNECSGYQVEENHFYSEGSTCDGIGLVVNNSLVDDGEINRIYRNTFTNLTYASLAQNRNRNAETGEGLCYKCNKFFNNYSDIAVTKDPGAIAQRDFGIAVNQGVWKSPPAPTDPAGNMFDYSPIPAHWDLNNELSQFLYYYHNGIIQTGYRVKPDEDLINGFIYTSPIPVNFNESTACPPSAPFGGENEDLAAMSGASEKADSIRNILATLVDAGSTESMLFEVQYSTPPEAISLQNDLLASSPYVSDTIMKTAIEKEEVLNNAMIRDVMVANPHSAKSEVMVDMLETRAIPMPGYMMEEILQGEDSISGKEVLEAQMAFWNQESSRHYHTLINSYRGDTIIGLANDSLLFILQLRNTVGSWYDLASTYLQRGDHETSAEVLGSIPGLFPLSSRQQDLHQSYTDLFDVLKKIASDSVKALNIDSADLSSLVSISGYDQGQVSAFARNLLLAADMITYCEPIIRPAAGLKSSKRHTYRRPQIILQDETLNVYPNPAYSHFTVEYQMKTPINNGVIEIADIMGKTVRRIPLTAAEDQLVISLRDFNKGVYIVSLINNGRSLKTAKITCLR